MIDPSEAGAPARPPDAASADEREYPRGYFPLGRDSLVVLRPPRAGETVADCTASLSEVVARTESSPVLPLAALIFHCSRCGSTLLARLLELDPANRVLAEPDTLPKFLLHHHAALAQGGFRRELRGFIQAFGLSPRPREQRLILKLNSLAIVHLPAFRAAFPTVPFYYLYREPAEVVASLAANPSLFLRDENRGTVAMALGESAEAVSPLSPAAWYAWYVDDNLRRAWAHRNEFTAAVDYADHRRRYLDIVQCFCSSPDGLDASAITGVFSRHSKNQTAAFSPATAARNTGSSSASDAFLRWKTE